MSPVVRPFRPQPQPQDDDPGFLPVLGEFIATTAADLASPFYQGGREVSKALHGSTRETTPLEETALGTGMGVVTGGARVASHLGRAVGMEQAPAAIEDWANRATEAFMQKVYGPQAAQQTGASRRAQAFARAGQGVGEMVSQFAAAPATIPISVGGAVAKDVMAATSPAAVVQPPRFMGHTIDEAKALAEGFLPILGHIAQERRIQAADLTPEQKAEESERLIREQGAATLVGTLAIGAGGVRWLARRQEIAAPSMEATARELPILAPPTEAQRRTIAAVNRQIDELHAGEATERRATPRQPLDFHENTAFVMRRPDGQIGFGGPVDAEFNLRRGGSTISQFDKAKNFEDNLAEAEKHARATQIPPRGFTHENLKAAFNLTDEQATATKVLAENMGLDLSKIGIQRGGEAGPGALKQEGRELSPLGFYDNIGEALKSWQPRGTPAQLMAHLQKTPGAMEEAKWIGLDDFLSGKRTVTRDEIAEHVRQNRVDVQETMIGDVGKTPLLWEEFDSGPEHTWTTNEGGRDYSITKKTSGKYYARFTRRGYSLDLDEEFGTLEAAQRWIQELRKEGPAEGKFKEYQLPGGQNYRELLLTMPSDQNRAAAAKSARVKELIARRDSLKAEYDATPPGQDRQRLTTLIENTGRQIDLVMSETHDRTAFTGGHFDEPNVLAHVRFNDRTAPDGKRVLFIEELQSDWAQKGRKEGFGQTITELPQGYTVTPMAEGEYPGFIVRRPNGEGVVARSTREGAVQAAIEHLNSAKKGIPSAPFVTRTQDWMNLSLKRILRYAAENGYDRIAWTTGEQQVSRYTEALQKAVDIIEWHKTPEGVQLIGYKGGGRPWEGERTREVVNTKYREDELSDAIGKAMADRIRSDPAQKGIIQGEDITISDTGMAGFYDKMMPAAVNKIAKKWGGKASQSSVGTTQTVDVRPLAVEGGTVWRVYVDGREQGRYKTKAAAEREAKEWRSEAAPSVHSIDITPSMKEGVMQGLPLFQKGKGATEFAEGGKAIIRGFQAADVSTGVHEIAHVARRQLLNRQTPAEQRLGITDHDITIAERWAGARNGEWSVAAEEKFARGFERYLREGRSPVPALTRVFEAFKQWLTNIYGRIKGTAIDVKISPQMQGVFDRLVTRREPMPESATAMSGIDLTKVGKQVVEGAKAGYKDLMGGPYGGEKPALNRNVTEMETYLFLRRTLDRLSHEREPGSRAVGDWTMAQANDALDAWRFRKKGLPLTRDQEYALAKAETVLEKGREEQPGEPTIPRGPISAITAGPRRYLKAQFSPLRDAEIAISKANNLEVPRTGIDKAFELHAGAAAKAEADFRAFERDVLRPLESDTPLPDDRIAALAMGPYQQHMNRALELQVENGRMSAEQLQEIRSMNDFYAPFKVLKYLDENEGKAGTGRGMTGAAPLTKAIVGIQHEDFGLGGLLRASAQQIVRSRILAEKNVKMLRLAKMADKDKAGIGIIRRLKEGEEPRRGYEVASFLDSGVETRLEMVPELARSLKGLGKAESEAAVAIARKAQTAFRWGATTANVGFQVFNVLSADVPRLALMSRYGIRTPADLWRFPTDVVRGFMAAAKGNAGFEDPIYEDFLRSNAANSTIARYFLPEAFTPGAAKAGVPKMILNGLAKMSSAVEEGTKVAGWVRAQRFEAARLAKMTPEQRETHLIEMAAEIRRYAGSPDFFRKGEQRMIGLLFNFFNARLEGVAADFGRLAGSTGAKDALAAHLRLAASIGIPTAVLTMINLRDENRGDDDATEQWEKDGYFRYPRNQYFTTVEGQRVRDYWKFPKREILKTYSNMIDAGIRYWADKDPQAFKRFASSFLSDIMPVNVQGETIGQVAESVVGSMNPVVSSPAQLAAGRSFFTHGPIVTPGLEREPLPEQYTQSTPQLYRMLGRLTGQSPQQIEFSIGSATGGFVGQLVPRAPAPGRPAYTEYPVARRLVRSTRLNLEPLYREYRPGSAVKAHLDRLVREGRQEEAQQYQSSNMDKLLAYYTLHPLVEMIAKRRRNIKLQTARGADVPTEGAPDYAALMKQKLDELQKARAARLPKVAAQ